MAGRKGTEARPAWAAQRAAADQPQAGEGARLPIQMTRNLSTSRSSSRCWAPLSALYTTRRAVRKRRASSPAAARAGPPALQGQAGRTAARPSRAGQRAARPACRKGLGRRVPGASAAGTDLVLVTEAERTRDAWRQARAVRKCCESPGGPAPAPLAVLAALAMATSVLEWSACPAERKGCPVSPLGARSLQGTAALPAW
mmetsp:Transcript_21416/g.49862  ORF Transcript_21416/g.49862 Transcript_21416/m.49862 type:complete len:200 (+) Transcript_21416:709-1308(+)